MEDKIIIENKLASIHSRIASLLIDFLIVQIIFSPIYLSVWFFINKSPSSILPGLGFFVSLGLILILFPISFSILNGYITLLQFKYGQTFGMKLMGIKIVDSEGNKFEIGKIAFRSFLIVGISGIALMVPIYGIVVAPFYLLLLLTYLLLRNNNNPTLVDKWFKTVIINENEKPYISKTVTYFFLIVVILLVAFLSLFVIDYFLQWKKEEAYRTQINTEMKSSNIDTTIKNPDEISSIPLNLTATTYSEIYNECMSSPESLFNNNVSFCTCFADEAMKNPDIYLNTNSCIGLIKR